MCSSDLGPKSEAGSKTAESPALSNTIVLDDARREALVAAISRAKRLPEERRARLLKTLSQPEVPRRLVERIEARMAGARQ